MRWAMTMSLSPQSGAYTRVLKSEKLLAHIGGGHGYK